MSRNPVRRFWPATIWAVMDSFYLPLVVRRRITFLAKSNTSPEPVSRAGGAGGSSPPSGRFRSTRSSADTSSGRAGPAERVLGEGKLLGMYPEGTRSPDGRLYKGKTGLAPPGAGDRRPVIPVAMIGTNNVNPPGTSMLRFGKVTVRFASRWTSPGSTGWRATASSNAPSSTR